MSYEIYQPDVLYPMFFHTFHIRPYATYDNCMTIYEQIGAALEHVNDVIKETNDMGTALVAFEKYVLDSLTEYDGKINTSVTTILNGLITDGTIANLINTLIFGQINTSITNLQNDLSAHQSANTTKFNQIDQAILDINYRMGSCQISSSPSQLLYNIGETINSVIILYTLTKGTDNVTEIKLYKNGVLINTISNPTINGSITDGSIISSDTVYKLSMYDGKNIVESNEIKINFVNNFYYGLVNDGITIDETLIKSLTSLKSLKDNLNESFTPNNQKILFAYPSSYGELSSIMDNDDYDMIDGFTKTIINLTLNGSQISYNYYLSNFAITDITFNLKFEF